MPKSVHSVLTGLFSDRQPAGRTHVFTWRLIRRRRRPFLLLPAASTQTSISLSLYSAQRRRARIWRAAMPLLLNTPLAAIFHRISFPAPENSEITRFLSEQSGIPAGELPAPAIKFGGMESQKSRLVLLVCDQTHRPLKVVKVGLDKEGRAATDREADLLERLPIRAPGCTRVTGRLATPELSAFATDYFPGDSPDNDLGMETLFQAWVNPGASEPIETFQSWQELETDVARSIPGAWAALRSALAGHRIRSSLHHGDFAPWNIRAVNLQNLQAFDWERGILRGFPAWDWFHFVVQTSILARRHSRERTAAEVELLLQSPRFKKYADFTGIAGIAKPLLLAYLLHHRWVIKPLEGGRQVEELFALLSARWELATGNRHVNVRHPLLSAPTSEARPGLWEDICGQLKSAWSQLANVFWEPTLTATVQPSLLAQLQARWVTALACGFWIAALAGIQHLSLSRLSLLPIFAMAPLAATWNMNRRWGTFFAALAAAAGPVVAAIDQFPFRQPDLICWNTLMRFIIFQMCVFLADRIQRQKDFFWLLNAPRHRRADLAGNWAVVLVSAIWFLLISWGDVRTGPLVLFLPLYLFPAILITLFMNLPWGTLVVLLAAINVSTDEYLSRFNQSALEVFGWNFPMRFAIMFTVILLLDRLRQESVLFTNRQSNGGAEGH